MNPLSPVIPSADPNEVVYAKNPPEYSIKNQDNNVALTRWSVSEEEKRQITEQGYIYLLVSTQASELPLLRLATYVPPDMGFETRPPEEWLSEINGYVQ